MTSSSSPETLPILYLVDPSVAVTGAFICARNEARALKNHVRIVLVLPEGSRIPPEALHDFWRVDYVPMVSMSKRLSTLWRYLPALLCGSWQLRRSMARDKASRLQLNDFYLMHGVILRLLGFRGHIASWIRCDPVAFAGILAAPMVWLTHRCANRLIAVSAFIASRLPAHYPVKVVYDFYASTPARTGQIETKQFLYIANYIEGKGQDMALEAFAIALARDERLRLSFHGGDMGLEKNRAYRQRLEKLAHEKGISHAVSFGDFLPDPSQVLAQAYAALNFSDRESFSMTVLEASGMGVPVIATASGGPQEIIREGMTGFLIPLHDAHAAAARILTLAQDTEQAARMGEAGALHVQEHFSVEPFRIAMIDTLKLTPI